MTVAMTLTVSLILTVMNEEETLPVFFASVDAQSRKPDEVILVDGGSTDGTLDVARSWRTDLTLRHRVRTGIKHRRGRNIAMRRASGSIVAVTDAGTRLDPDWLDKLVEPFQRRGSQQPDVVAGFFEARSAKRVRDRAGSDDFAGR